jgi:hypothetical protein
MAGEEIFFEQIRSGGCLSYILGCKREKVCVVIDPEIDKADDYVELARFFGSRSFTPSTPIPMPTTIPPAR